MLNADLTSRASVQADELDWMPSPMNGVERRMLFRIGEEQARATSIVRYAPGSSFSRHEHPGGEEIFVLDGVFQDETGDFPAGSYIRNPPGTGHAPKSDVGCIIFVKLWQLSASDRQRIVRQPREGEATRPRSGVAQSRMLFESPSEHVVLEQWSPGAEIVLMNPEGLELLVVDGTIQSEGDMLRRMGWLRIPAGEPLHAQAVPHGAQIWLKWAPLRHEDVCAFA
ncbi:cupin [Sphingobium lactosutens]|uniref:cupin domain-containing protein n=1 Tax=Sphingobium lactosutens TaxID=522773 RepID=UPI0015BC7918|nr:cupin domain-containing protein [Sphingobium lactosutens]NWK99173.1 cupin [Sphingobium lactosutens]